MNVKITGNFFNGLMDGENTIEFNDNSTFKGSISFLFINNKERNFYEWG